LFGEGYKLWNSSPSNFLREAFEDVRIQLKESRILQAARFILYKAVTLYL
jgi:hypothetical protein